MYWHVSLLRSQMCVCVGNVNITLYCYFLKGEDLALWILHRYLFPTLLYFLCMYLKKSDWGRLGSQGALSNVLCHRCSNVPPASQTSLVRMKEMACSGPEVCSSLREYEPRHEDIWRRKVEVHTFLSSPLDGGEWSNSSASHFTTSAYWIWCRVGP